MLIYFSQINIWPLLLIEDMFKELSFDHTFPDTLLYQTILARDSPCYKFNIYTK